MESAFDCDLRVLYMFMAISAGLEQFKEYFIESIDLLDVKLVKMIRLRY